MEEPEGFSGLNLVFSSSEEKEEVGIRVDFRYEPLGCRVASIDIQLQREEIPSLELCRISDSIGGGARVRDRGAVRG
jgi:hypothetical protein